MAISITRYVDIVSAVGGAAAVSQRDLIGRIFTQNTEMPTQTILEFDNASDVGDYFGFETQEYARAVFYFGFVSKNVTQAKKIGYVRYVPLGTAAQIIGSVAPTTLASYTGITDGAFDLSCEAEGSPDIFFPVTAMNFSGDGSLNDVAATIQAAVQAADAAANYIGAVVVYDALHQHFLLTMGVVGDFIIKVAAPSTGGTDILALIGWDPALGAQLSNGILSETPASALADATEVSNNFGSFCFEPPLTVLADVESAADWNDAENVLYMFNQPVIAADAVAWSAALDATSGIGLTLYDAADLTEFPEMGPMALLAATNYSQVNAVQNYMFQQFGLTPLVTTNGDANLYDDLNINYNGRTQQAGNTLDFYQRGILMGTDSDPIDMNTYANEQWLKDFATAQLMNLLLALPRVPANNAGKAMVLAVLQAAIDLALINGSISVGKTLTSTQKAYITSITGDERAHFQVATSGYYITASVIFDDPDFVIDYLLIYSKDDAVRRIDGRHVLI